MNSITLDDLHKAVDELGPEKPVRGFVFASRLEGEVRKMFKERAPQTAASLEPLHWGIPCYFDPRQNDDCLAFYDREMLRRYLVRYSSAKAWFDWAEYMFAAIRRNNAENGF